MLNRHNIVFRLARLITVLWLGSSSCLAQSQTGFPALQDKTPFSDSDLPALERGHVLVKLLSPRDKREVAVGGLVRVETTADSFLQSFRESMVRKNNPAILQIGRFSDSPLPSDLQELTLEDRDIEDLKKCTVGNCKLKFSGTMIERLQREVDWGASNYREQATLLVRQMLLDYVRDYINRGDAALIQYRDKQKEVSVAQDQRELNAVSSNDVLMEIDRNPKTSLTPKLEMIESAIVWSKIKYGLKPVIAINHIKIYKAAQDSGTSVLIVSKQIYANHYFDSSLALTAFLTVPGDPPRSYLFYENRSRLDCLVGMFGDIKRGMVEDEAEASLESILHQSQLSFQATAFSRDDVAVAYVQNGLSLGGWRVGRRYVFVLLLSLTGLVFFVGLRVYRWNSLSKSFHY